LKIISIVGARPQFIKLAPLSKKIREHFTEIIIHTGQHYDNNMSDSFFKDLNIPAVDYDLGVGSGEHGQQTAEMLKGISEILIKESPDGVVVFGDTNSTLAGALAASKLNFPLIHIEAGLRSYNRTMPEEINRVATDHLSDYLFAPSKVAMENLEKENLLDRAHQTGDIMVDSLSANLKKAQQDLSIIKATGLEPEKYYLLTLHRPYNVDEPGQLKQILNELARLNITIIFPAHPRTQKIIKQNNISVADSIRIIEPLGYLNFINLQSNAAKIITDSGGVQKEAYLLGKPCITLRTETEWTETVEAGWNFLIDSTSPNLAAAIASFNPTGNPLPLYGQEVAAKMVETILKVIS
jgi:UDP-GlcNAc3NAcA epimerase